MRTASIRFAARLGALAAALLVAAPAARGADPLPGRMPGLQLPPRMERPAGPVKVGSWAEFAVVDRRLRTRLRLHWALVATDPRGRWWELTFRKPRQPTLRIKLLAREKTTGPTAALRVIVQAGNNPPLELPLKQGQKVMDLYLRRGAAGAPTDLGKVRLSTAAGTFQTHHRRWRDDQGQLVEEWSSPSAAIWGLVRFRNARFEMELIGQGTGAVSRIRGTPTRWHIPGL